MPPKMFDQLSVDPSSITISDTHELELSYGDDDQEYAKGGLVTPGSVTTHFTLTSPAVDWDAINLALHDYLPRFVPNVKSISFSSGATVVWWADGTKTVVRRSEGEASSPYSAFTAALAKKVCGSTSAVHKLIDRKDKDKEEQRIRGEKEKARQEQEKVAEKKREKRLRREAKKLLWKELVAKKAAEMKEAEK